MLCDMSHYLVTVYEWYSVFAEVEHVTLVILYNDSQQRFQFIKIDSSTFVYNSLCRDMNNLCNIFHSGIRLYGYFLEISQNFWHIPPVQYRQYHCKILLVIVTAYVKTKKQFALPQVIIVMLCLHIILNSHVIWWKI